MPPDHDGARSALREGVSVPDYSAQHATATCHDLAAAKAFFLLQYTSCHYFRAVACRGVCTCMRAEFRIYSFRLRADTTGARKVVAVGGRLEPLSLCPIGGSVVVASDIHPLLGLAGAGEVPRSSDWVSGAARSRDVV